MQTDPLDAAFGALADPTRRAILARLAEGEATVGEVAAPFGLALPTISRHLDVLEGAGLVSRRKDAQRRICRIEGRGLAEAGAWLARYAEFWEGRLDALERLVADLAKEETKK